MTVPLLAAQMQYLLTTVTDEVATRQSFAQRPDRAVLTAPTLVQSLVLGWLHQSDATLTQLAQGTALAGTPITPQSLDERFNWRTAALLRGVLERTVETVMLTQPVAIELLRRFDAVRVSDSTRLTFPRELAEVMGASAHGLVATLKCGVQLDLTTGAITALDVVPGRQNDRMLPHVQHPPDTMGLELRDLGFFSATALAALSAADSAWVSRTPSHIRVGLTRATRMPLTQFAARVARHAAWDGMVWMGGAHPLHVRLLLVPLPVAVRQAREARIHERARERGVPPSSDALALAGWTVIITNRDETQVSVHEAIALYRARWQIELLFKVWKSVGQIATWRTTKPARIACEVWAKLIGQLLQHAMVVLGCWEQPQRSIVKAVQIVKTHAVHLLHARGCVTTIAAILTDMITLMTRYARQNRRRQRPSTMTILSDVARLYP